jgi:hypothetical protein
MVIIIWSLIWLLGVMLGVNFIRLGAAHLLPRRETPTPCQRASICVVTSRALGVALILLGLLLIYAACAPIAHLPGHAWFNHTFLM